MGDCIPHRLLRQAIDRPSAPAYQQKVNGRWQPTTWKTYADQVRTVARALIALGLPLGGKVSILGFNRPEWVIFDHAAMLAGGVPAGIYTTCSAEEVQYIVHHSESHVALVENAEQLAKIKAKRAELPHLKWIVTMRGATATGDDVLTWDELCAKGEHLPDAELDQRIDQIADGDLATLIYTSGTTGPPKGVMLSHGNLAWTAANAVALGGAREPDVLVSYLPLSHIAEQMCTLHVPATSGACVYFVEAIEKVADAIKEAHPTVFFGVPRIWEKFHAAMAAKMAEATGAKKRLLEWARGVCTKVNQHRDRGEPLPKTLEAQYKLADRIAMSKIKAAIGFDRVRDLLSGAAPIAPDVLEFFASIDLPVREAYGMSENCGATSVNMKGMTRLGSVGPSRPGTQCKLADDGEILVKGPTVFLGYFKDPEATAEALKDGWLYSGDLGAFDAEGFLTITGRKKEIIITAGGKNIAPKNIEAMIKESPLVGEAVVIGDRRKYLTALVTLEPTHQVPAEKIHSTIQAKIDEVNQSLARVEQIKKFTVLERPFGIDSGELTPTMKIKRKVVAQKYAREIEAMYADAD